MTEPTDRQLISDVESTVRAVPGVTAIFRAGGSLSKLVHVGAELLGVNQNEAPLIRWERSLQGPRVEVAIGVHATAGSKETCSQVHAAIAALCADRGLTPTEIHITVVHIDDTSGTDDRRWNDGNDALGEQSL